MADLSFAATNRMGALAHCKNRRRRSLIRRRKLSGSCAVRVRGKLAGQLRSERGSGSVNDHDRRPMTVAVLVRGGAALKLQTRKGVVT